MVDSLEMDRVSKGFFEDEKEIRYDPRAEEGTVSSVIYSNASAFQRLVKEYFLYTHISRIPYPVGKARFNLKIQIHNLEDLAQMTDPRAPLAEERVALICDIKSMAENLFRKIKLKVPEEYADVMWDTTIGSDMMAFGPCAKKSLMKGRAEGFLTPKDWEKMMRNLVSTTLQKYYNRERYLLSVEDHIPEKNAELVYALMFVIENGFDGAPPIRKLEPEDSSGISYISDGGTSVLDIDRHYAGYRKGFEEYVKGRKRPIADVIKQRRKIKSLAKSLEGTDEEDLTTLVSPCFSGNVIKSAAHLLLQKSQKSSD